MTFELPLLAKLDDWIQIILLLLFLIVSLLTKFMSKVEGPGPQQGPVPPEPQAGNPPQPIELILEQLFEETRGKELQSRTAGPPRGTAPSNPSKVPTPGERRSRRGVNPKMRSPRPVRKVASAPVQQRPDSSSVSQQGQSLGSQIDVADERLEEHLRSVFGHQVGGLASATQHSAEVYSVGEGTDAATWAGTSANAQVQEAHDRLRRLRETLRQPDGIRNAFVLGEILRRPGELP